MAKCLRTHDCGRGKCLSYARLQSLCLHMLSLFRQMLILCNDATVLYFVWAQVFTTSHLTNKELTHVMACDVAVFELQHCMCLALSHVRLLAIQIDFFFLFNLPPIAYLTNVSIPIAILIIENNHANSPTNAFCSASQNRAICAMPCCNKSYLFLRLSPLRTFIVTCLLAHCSCSNFLWSLQRILGNGGCDCFRFDHQPIVNYCPQ